MSFLHGEHAGARGQVLLAVLAMPLLRSIYAHYKYSQVCSMLRDLSAASAEFKSMDSQACSGGTHPTTNPRATPWACSQYSQNNKEQLRRSLGNTGI